MGVSDGPLTRREVASSSCSYILVLDRMQTKLVTSTARVPSLETAAIENQESLNSHQYENPFRDEGDLSEYAKDVVDAVKSGNLDKIVPKADAEYPQPDRDTEQ